jgi:UDP-3-O-[3-hydroxymyristoyl] glucosamine N-acyltransferase
MPKIRCEIDDLLNFYKSSEIKFFNTKILTNYIDSLVSVENTSEQSLTFLTKPKYILKSINDLKGLVLIDVEISSYIDLDNMSCSYIVIEDARYAFAATHQYIEKLGGGAVKELSHYIKSKFKSKIFKNSNVSQLISIGEGTVIHPGVRLNGPIKIGKNSVIKANSVIGGQGFGFARRLGYPPMAMPSLGGVIIGDNVFVGSNCTIDQGTFSNTIISSDVKIDNGVHIAHNVIVSPRTIITAHVEISGSTKIGSDTYIAPNVCIREGLEIGDNVLLGIGSTVVKDVPDNAVAFGSPARIMRFQN